MKKLKQILPILTILLVSCSENSLKSKIVSKDSNSHDDSLEIVNATKNVYKWHDSAQKELQDYSVIIVDSFQTGLDFQSFEKTLKAINDSHLFSNSFINNYTEIGKLINNKLTTANPKYLNEINFPYQEADPWTNFQDDANHFWDSFIISDFKISSDSASFNWYIQEKYSKTDKYLVKLVKENKKWVISYLDGFNKNLYSQ